MDSDDHKKDNLVEFLPLSDVNNGKADASYNSEFNKEYTSNQNSLHPELNFCGDVTDYERGEKNFFEDGIRRIDFILAWPTNLKNNLYSIRNIYIENLLNEGLEIEDDYKDGRKIQFTKIHAPHDLLLRYADLMKIRMPIKENMEEVAPIGIWDKMTGFLARCLHPFELSEYEVPKVHKKYTCPFQSKKQYLFKVPENSDEIFTRATRSRIVDYILRRTEFNPSAKSMGHYGINSLISKGIYSAAFPLHEGSWRSHSQMSYRKLLYRNWASSRVWFKLQPLQYIRSYFGEKIGFYFAWLGYYTYALVPASIVGLLVFIYGLINISLDVVADETCDMSNNFTMCPKCNVKCGYWGYHRMCWYIIATHFFDNPATVFFAIFMSLWGTIFLEFWKREEASIQYLWDLKNFEEEDEPPRPEYLNNIANSKYKRENKYTKQFEHFFPFWRRTVPVYLASISIMLFLILVVLAIIIGLIFYRISFLAVLYMLDAPMVYKKAPIIVSASAAFINLLIIFILNYIYSRAATKLTDWECHRTQTLHDNSLRYKFYTLQFVNYYSSLFYIAFFKGRFIGMPAKYVTFFGARLEECEGGSCLTELCIQLAVIFVGKQLIQNNIMEIYIPRLRQWCCSGKKKKGLTVWEKDFYMEEMGNLGLLQEYLEMMIQFGFVTLFVAAFPLAPFFAFLNNLIELRADATKFVKSYRRPTPSRSFSIGVWYEILYALTRISIITNACIIAFTSSFIQREIYRRLYSETGTLAGYVNNSLSYFDVKDFSNGTAPNPANIKEKYRGVEFCRYSDYREPPWSERKYQYTTQHWHILAAQFIFVVAFENLIILTTSIIAYMIPDTSGQLEEMMRRESMIVSEIVLTAELNIAKGDRPALTEIDLLKIRRRVMNTQNVAANPETEPLNIIEE